MYTAMKIRSFCGVKTADDEIFLRKYFKISCTMKIRSFFGVKAADDEIFCVNILKYHVP